MCLAVLALEQHARFPLVVAANRDEFFARAAAPLAWWSPAEGRPDILGGRDLSAGGTWMGLTRAGRLALVTNVRAPGQNDATAPSRGEIVPLWLRGDRHMSSLWPTLAMAGYNGFNLLAADFAEGEFYWVSNVRGDTKRLVRGLYGLSNAQLDTPWPKVVALKASVKLALGKASDTRDLASMLFTALGNKAVARDSELPATGVPLEWERLLSAAHIGSAEGLYGTRCATVMVAERINGQVTTHVFERTFKPDGQELLSRSASVDHWPPAMPRSIAKA